MPEINIANNSGRDAVVNLENLNIPLKVRWLDTQKRQVSSMRILKSTVDHDIESLSEQNEGIAGVADALIHGDPEVDMEIVGSYLRNTSRAYIDRSRNIVHKVTQWEIVRSPDGSERERRLRELPPQNVTGEIPLQWSGVMIKKEEAIRKFVFVNKMQLTHINGLTYDFLFTMAEELEKKNSLMLLGGGPKSNQPLVLRRGGAPYRGFLEGRVRGDRYCLLLHLSNLELRAPVDEAEPSSE